MKRLIWVGVGVAVVIIAVGVSRSPFGQRFHQSMAAHEADLRAQLLPDEESLALARETRARHRQTELSDDDLTDAVVLPDDGTDYF